MERHKYLEYQYKIDYRVMEEIWGASMAPPATDHIDDLYFIFRERVGLEHYLMFDEDGRMDNPDGCYYFNDIDELVFQEAREEEKALMRIKIKENMVPRETVL
ncbi:hypothetical protein [Ligilactobacillus murinus]|uniref:hypothetical protein n=1 Tax=Ligilactobacillus murinus TaxID=1622 RepID=UPI00096D1BEF|nr:hypothetical protein [Ligilactobacillus murinus]